MKYALFPIFAFLTLIPYSSFSQEYSYTHYDITEGLAGSTVYCITQDRDGFIWVGTETGVSRFDGTHFKNFTTTDGLPDIEILQLFGDSKGRVWMAPFRKSVCYYYKGRIYNQDNDSLLRAIRFKGNIENFAEDDHGNILIQERTALHLITAAGQLRQYDSIGNQPIQECRAIGRSAAGHFTVQEGQRIFDLTDKGFSFSSFIHFPDFHPNYIAMNPYWMAWREQHSRSAIRSFSTGQVFYHPFDSLGYKHISYSLVDDSLAYFNEMVGTTEYNLHTGKMQQFLPGKEVSRTFRDISGNLWFTTMGQGIYRLNSSDFRTIGAQTADGARSSVSAVRRIGQDLWFGNSHNRLFKLSLKDFKVKRDTALAYIARTRILFIDKTEDDHILVASENGLSEMTNEMHVIQGMGTGIKSVFKKNDHEFLLGSSTGVTIFNIHSFRLTDTLWRERSTAVYACSDTTYIGTLNGLYRINPDKSIFFLGQHIPFLRKRISSVVESADHILWAASFDDAGVIGIKNDRVVATITKTQGLTSDICKILIIHNNILWIGTDKGLNKVELDKPGRPVTSFTSNDGLSSDVINTLYADSAVVYVGTTAGLSYFDGSKTNMGEDCRIYLLGILNAGAGRIDDTSHLVLSYKDNDIRLDFAGISYRSAGNITYRYRMNDLDSSWKLTKDTYLAYPTLPSGNYRFQLQAINKFGTGSRILSLNFIVTTPFWKTIWFYSLVIAVFLYLVWLTVSIRIKGIRHRQEEKEQLNQKMFQLEHRALQAQMNPHFIFNCLNSIQQNIFVQDIFSANKYISGLAKLIRATLHNSSRPFISLAEEIEFLSTYLSLEKLRFKDKMEYTVVADPGIDRHSLLIPPMILQPYVENSMRHGLRHKTEGTGYIRIDIKQESDRLKITIEDNGIGRERAARYKTAEHIEYQSRGMSLTADRIRIMNTAYGKDIKVEVTDLEDDKGLPAGTRVIIQFLLFDNNIEK